MKRKLQHKKIDIIPNFLIPPTIFITSKKLSNKGLNIIANTIIIAIDFIFEIYSNLSTLFSDFSELYEEFEWGLTEKLN